MFVSGTQNLRPVEYEHGDISSIYCMRDLYDWMCTVNAQETSNCLVFWMLRFFHPLKALLCNMFINCSAVTHRPGSEHPMLKVHAVVFLHF